MHIFARSGVARQELIIDRVNILPVQREIFKHYDYTYIFMNFSSPPPPASSVPKCQRVIFLRRRYISVYVQHPLRTTRTVFVPACSTQTRFCSPRRGGGKITSGDTSPVTSQLERKRIVGFFFPRSANSTAGTTCRSTLLHRVWCMARAVKSLRRPRRVYT